jgi:hypothetical protein
MEWMNINKDDSRTKKLFLHYYHHEWKKKISQQKLWFIVLPVAFVLFITNIISGKSEQDYNFFFFTFVSFIVISYLPFLYFFQILRLYKSLRKITAETPPVARFRFNEEGTWYQAEEVFEHQSWDSFKYYSINKSEVYLYNHKGFVQQIIAENIIGSAHFNEVLGIIKNRLTPKYH